MGVSGSTSNEGELPNNEDIDDDGGEYEIDEIGEKIPLGRLVRSGSDSNVSVGGWEG